MKEFRFFAQLLLIVSLAVTFVSCEKEEDDVIDTYMSMDGNLDGSIPSFVMRNELVTMVGRGITDPQDVEYRWLLTGLYADTLKTNPITVHFPDTMTQYTISLVARKEGYYDASSTNTVVVIDTAYNTSLKGIPMSPDSFLDSRDDKLYHYVTVGDLDWFSQNLAYSGAGQSFMFSPATEGLFGRFYTWKEATGGVSAHGLGNGPQGVCPEGWSVPTNEDWENLASVMGGSDTISFFDKWKGLGSKASVDAVFNGVRMWNYSPDNAHTNDFGWNAIPLGNTQFGHTFFVASDGYGFWWSSSEKDDTHAYFRYMYYDTDEFPMSSTSKGDFGATLRCVRKAAISE